MVEYKYFFWYQTETCLLKIYKVRKVFDCVARAYYFQCQVSWVIVKCVIFFASLCWLWDFLLENLKLKKKSDEIQWNVWTNIKTLYARNNIFKKRISNIRFLKHLYFGPSFVFQVTAFLIFRRRPTMVVDIFAQPPPTIKKLPTALLK